MATSGIIRELPPSLLRIFLITNVKLGDLNLDLVSWQSDNIDCFSFTKIVKNILGDHKKQQTGNVSQVEGLPGFKTGKEVLVVLDYHSLCHFWSNPQIIKTHCHFINTFIPRQDVKEVLEKLRTWSIRNLSIFFHQKVSWDDSIFTDEIQSPSLGSAVSKAK